MADMHDPLPIPAARLFDHEAMHTTFQLRICESDPTLARDMACECFARLDLLESQLSRFIAGSDVSRINQMAAGETLYISEPCHQCLLIALEAHARTGGLFDITLGSRIEHQKSGASGPLPPLSGILVVHPDVAAVTCVEPGRQIDLGGIGKGFALDQLQQLLIDWGAEGGLLAAGASSLLAFGPQAWPVDLSGDKQSVRIALRDAALSASGTGIQGSHLVHPGGTAAMPTSPCKRVWVTAANAALAETWSTALMLLEPENLRDFIACDESLRSVHIDHEGTIQSIHGNA
jgi:FAD:protein FMN transferase